MWINSSRHGRKLQKRAILPGYGEVSKKELNPNPELKLYRGRHVTLRPFLCRELPAPRSSRFKEPSEAIITHPSYPGKQYNGSMMSCANPEVFSSLREGPPARRDLALDARPSSLVEKRFVL